MASVSPQARDGSCIQQAHPPHLDSPHFPLGGGGGGFSPACCTQNKVLAILIIYTYMINHAGFDALQGAAAMASIFRSILGIILPI